MKLGFEKKPETDINKPVDVDPGRAFRDLSVPPAGVVKDGISLACHSGDHWKCVQQNEGRENTCTCSCGHPNAEQVSRMFGRLLSSGFDHFTTDNGDGTFTHELRKPDPEWPGEVSKE